MTFQPQVGEPLAIDGVVYHVVAHPNAPGMPYGQEGRQATVYQVMTSTKRQALKVFKPRYRVPAMVDLSKSSGDLRCSSWADSVSAHSIYRPQAYGPSAPVSRTKLCRVDALDRGPHLDGGATRRAGVVS